MSFVGRNNKKITNRPSGGGDKKQGLAPKATHFFRPVSTGSQYSIDSGSGQDRFNFFCINQLGNIGGGRNNSMFGSSSDGPNVNFQFALAKQQGFNTTFNDNTDSNIIIDPLLGKEITIYPIPGTWTTNYKGNPVSPTFLNPQPWLNNSDSWIKNNDVWFGRDKNLFNTIIFIQLTPPVNNTAAEIFNAIISQANNQANLPTNVSGIYYTYNIKYNQVIYDDNLTRNPKTNKLPNGQTYIYIIDESIKNIISNVVIIITINNPNIPASVPDIWTISGANNFSSMLNLCILDNVNNPPQDYTTKVKKIKEHAKTICDKMDGDNIYFCTTDGDLFIPDDPNYQAAQKPQFIYQHWGYTNNDTIYYTPSLYIPNNWNSSNTLYIDFKGNYDYNLTTTLIVFNKKNFPHQEEGTKIIENFTNIIKGICISNNQTAIFQMQNYLEIFKQYPYPPGVESFSGEYYYTPYLTCNIHIFGENNNLSSESILDNWLGIPWINNDINATNARLDDNRRLDKIKDASCEDLALAIQAWSNAGAIEIYTNGDVKIFDLNITGFIPRGRSGIQINGYNSKRGGYKVFTNNIADVCNGTITPVTNNLDDPNYLSSKVLLSRINILNNWIYQADGFDVISPGLDMHNCIVQSADDGIKLQSNNSNINNISSIQGNSGGAIAIGGYGYSKYNKDLENIDISGVSVMRICQSYKDSQNYNSAIINIINNTTNNCNYNNITISNIYVPEISLNNGTGINQPNMFFTLGWADFNGPGGGPPTAGAIKNIKIQNAYIYSQPIFESTFFLGKNAEFVIPGGPDPSSNIIIPLGDNEFVLDLTTNVFIVSDPTKPPFVWYGSFAGFHDIGASSSFIYIPKNGGTDFGSGRGYKGSMNNTYNTLPFLGPPNSQGTQDNPDPNILPSSGKSGTGGTNIDIILPVLIKTTAAPDGFWYVAKGIKI